MSEPQLMADETVMPSTWRLFNEIGIINQLSTTRLERQAPHGLTAAQFGLLMHLARLGGEWSLVRLANSFEVTKGAMTSLVKRLSGKGFIDVKPSETDGRGKKVSLTQSGRAALNDAMSALAPDLQRLDQAMTTAELTALIDGLTMLRKYLDDNRLSGD